VAVEWGGKKQGAEGVGSCACRLCRGGGRGIAVNAGFYLATLQRPMEVQGTMSRVCFRSTNADLFRGRHDRHTIRIRRLISGVMGAFPWSFKKITAERILTYHRAYSLRQLIKSAAQICRLGANPDACCLRPVQRVQTGPPDHDADSTAANSGL
jgi:hypothetical protein